MSYYRVKQGLHLDKHGTHKPGTIVESEEDLVRMDPLKFEKVDGPGATPQEARAIEPPPPPPPVYGKTLEDQARAIRDPVARKERAKALHELADELEKPLPADVEPKTGPRSPPTPAHAPAHTPERIAPPKK